VSVSDSPDAGRWVGVGLGLLIAAPAVTFVALASVPNAPTTLACYGGLVIDQSTDTCVPADWAPADAANMPHCNSVETLGSSSIACAPGEFQYIPDSPAGGGR